MSDMTPSSLGPWIGGGLRVDATRSNDGLRCVGDAEARECSIYMSGSGYRAPGHRGSLVNPNNQGDGRLPAELGSENDLSVRDDGREVGEPVLLYGQRGVPFSEEPLEPGLDSHPTYHSERGEVEPVNELTEIPAGQVPCVCSAVVNLCACCVRPMRFCDTWARCVPEAKGAPRPRCRLCRL